MTIFYAKTRIDSMSHDRTRWFSEREHGLMLQCKTTSRFGILERSLAGMARKASGDGQTLTVTPAQIEESISRLSNTGHVVWFREHEVLWWVEMADEQKPTDPAKQPNYWTQLRTQLLPKLVNQVRVAICTRYPVLVSGKTEGNPEPAKKLVNQVGLFGSLDRDQDRDLDQDRDRDRDRVNPNRGTAIRRHARAKPNGRKAKQDLGVDPELIDGVIGHFNACRAAVIDAGTGYRTSSACHRKPIAKATKREGASFEDWRERIDRLTEAATRDEFWRPHLTPEHLHWQKNWERWSHDSSIPTARSGRTPNHAPSNFNGPDSIGLLRCCDTLQEHDIALVLRVAGRISQRLQRPTRQILGVGRAGGLWPARSLLVVCSMRLGVNREEIAELMGRRTNTLTNYASGFRRRARRDTELRRAYFEIVEAEQFAARCSAAAGEMSRGLGPESGW